MNGPPFEPMPPAERTLFRFLTDNQCRHCWGIPLPAWDLARSFSLHEGLVLAAAVPPVVCHGCEDPGGAWDVAALDRTVSAFVDACRVEAERRAVAVTGVA
jgi:hypothetical protein